MLDRHEADLSFASLSPSTQRQEVMDFADLPLTQTYSTGIYRKPEPEKNTLKLFLLPFETNVWQLIILAMVVVSVTFTAAQYLNPTTTTTTHNHLTTFNKMKKGVAKVYTSFEYVFATLLTQSQLTSHSTRRPSVRIFIAAPCNCK